MAIDWIYLVLVYAYIRYLFAKGFEFLIREMWGVDIFGTWTSCQCNFLLLINSTGRLGKKREAGLRRFDLDLVLDSKWPIFELFGHPRTEDLNVQEKCCAVRYNDMYSLSSLSHRYHKSVKKNLCPFGGLLLQFLLNIGFRG